MGDALLHVQLSYSIHKLPTKFAYTFHVFRPWTWFLWWFVRSRSTYHMGYMLYTTKGGWILCLVYFSSMKIGKHVGSGLVINGIDRKFMFKALENVSAKTENCLHMYVGREPSEHADERKNLLGIESWIEEWEVDIQLWPCIFQGAFINAINLSRWNITPLQRRDGDLPIWKFSYLHPTFEILNTSISVLGYADFHSHPSV